MKRGWWLLLGILFLSCSRKEEIVKASEIQTAKLRRVLAEVEKEMKKGGDKGEEYGEPQKKEEIQEAFRGDPAKGRALYQQACATCHGVSGKGDGPAAAGLPVKPRDHTDGKYMNARTDKQIFLAIKEGGQAVGVSPAMPPFGSSLSDEQIKDLVAYVRTLSSP